MKKTGPTSTSGASNGSIILPKKKPNASQQLESENKKMEDKLKEVQALMEIEKQKRASGQTTTNSTTGSKENSTFRSATSKTSASEAAQNQKNQAKIGGGQPAFGNQSSNLLNNISAAKIGGPAGVVNSGMDAGSVEMKSASSAVSQMTVGSKPPLPKSTSEPISEEAPEVMQFLSAIQLSKYYSKFVENGIEDLETILELNDSHLDALGVPLGYKLKVLKRIKTLRQEKGMSQLESRSNRPDTASSQVESNVRAVTNHDYSELPEPTPQQMNQQQPQKSALKQPKKQLQAAEYLPVPSGLAAGEFNEAESHNSFLEALNAWRQVDPQQPGQPAEKPKPTYTNSSGNSKNTRAMNQMPIKGQFAVKQACYTCFKLKPNNEIITFKQKTFCSDLCKARFVSENFITCQCKPGCTKKSEPFLKREGVPRFGKWFCSDECSEQDTDVIKIVKDQEAKAQRAEEDQKFKDMDLKEQDDDYVIDL